MKICPKCKDEHEKPGTFCTRTCANSRVFSKSAKQKKSIATRKDWKLNKEKKLLGCIKAAKTRRAQDTRSQAVKDNEKYDRNILREWKTIGWDTMRWLVLYEQKFKCASCERNTWLDEPLVLEVDHIDGDRQNNKRGNLKGLCPNCHSLTTTWRGKHQQGKLGLTDEDLYVAYMKAGNVAQTIKNLNLNRASRKRILNAVEKLGDALG